MKKSEKIFAVIKNFLGHTSFYFTVIVMFFNTLISVTFPDGGKVFQTKMFWWILLFSAIYALCNFILDIKFIESYIAKLCIHYVLIIADFAIVIAWLSGAAETQKTMVFVVIVFAFLYLIVEIVRGIIHGVTHKKNNEQEEYKTLFTGENN